MSEQEGTPSIAPTLPPRVAARTSWQIFLTTLWAFMLREMKNQFGRRRLGYFWAFAEPAAIVAILTTLHAFIRGGHSNLYGESPVIFFVFGAIPYFTFANSVAKAQGSSVGQRGLFNYPQIRPLDIMIARCVIDSLTMVAVLVVFLFGWWWLGNTLTFDDPLMLIFCMFLLFLLGIGLGFIFEVFGNIFTDMKPIFGIIMRPMFFISGLFFTIDMIPLEYRGYLIWNPVLHAVDLTRDAVLDGYTSPASLLYVMLTVLVLFFIGFAGYRRYQHELI